MTLQDKIHHANEIAKVEGEGHCFRMKGMYVNVKTMRRATRELADSMNRLGWMMSN